MAVITGARHRTGVSAGVAGDTSNYGPFIMSGAPAGNFGGTAEKGALLIDNSNAKLYINTGTIGSPVWTVVGSQAE